jgi:hypothetical protein
LFTQFTSSALKNSASGTNFKLLSSAEAKNPSGVDETGWLTAPSYTNTRARKRIREILATSPALLTGDEIINARVLPAQAKGDTQVSGETIRPTDPSGIPCVHVQNNLGQLLLSPQGEATLRFYGSTSVDPFATYKLKLDVSK